MGPEQLVEDLKKDLATGRVLVVVGTGVSIAASGNDPRASWAGLIRDGIERCQRLGLMEPAEAKTLLESLAKETNNTALIAIAKQLESKLKGRDLKRWLKESAGNLPLDKAKRPIIEAIHALGAKIATTNYDDLLSRGRGLEAIPWKDIDAVRELINGDRPREHFTRRLCRCIARLAISSGKHTGSRIALPRRARAVRADFRALFDRLCL